MKDLNDLCKKLADIINECQIEILEYCKSIRVSELRVSRVEWVSSSNSSFNLPQTVSTEEVIERIKNIKVIEWCEKKEQKNIDCNSYGYDDIKRDYFEKYIKNDGLKLLEDSENTYEIHIEQLIENLLKDSENTYVEQLIENIRQKLENIRQKYLKKFEEWQEERKNYLIMKNFSR
ncbi:hypothetical protein [Desulfurella multipotens]|nr:hypothetical protein [Desulfurella multipotens]